MGFFAKFGELIIKFFSFLGMLVLEVLKIPQRIRNLNTGSIREKIDTEGIKDNLSKIREDVKDKRSESSKTETPPKLEKEASKESKDPADTIKSGLTSLLTNLNSEDKETTILELQILSAGFLIFCVLYALYFMSLAWLVVLGGVMVFMILYILFSRIKVMYAHDFEAYRDFFLMYIAVGIILVLVSSNSNLVMAFSFQLLPSLSLLLFAAISVVAVFLIFRIRYHRNYTYGRVIETREMTAQVKVEYDIRSNVKPDVYAVENTYGAQEGDLVKLKIDEKLLSISGNRPVSIMETVNEI